MGCLESSGGLRYVFFFFKQKTAYGMRISDWSSDVCSSDLPKRGPNTVTLQLPTNAPGFTVVDEKFIARNYSMLEQATARKREVKWAIRRARGEQALYYRATLVRSTLGDEPDLASEPTLAKPPPPEKPWGPATPPFMEEF